MKTKEENVTFKIWTLQKKYRKWEYNCYFVFINYKLNKTYNAVPLARKCDYETFEEPTAKPWNLVKYVLLMTIYIGINDWEKFN